jgi:hypothetical protein
MDSKKLISFILCLLIIQAVSASVISLTTTVTTEIMGEKTAKTHVKLLNSGDETAHNVQVSLITDNFKTDQLYVGNLEPNIPFDGNINITKTKETLPGNYPLVILTDYADANGYPFSAVSRDSITYKTPTVYKVSGVFSELSLSGKQSKKLVLTLRNLDSIPHDLKIKLILPRELKAVSEDSNVTIGTKEEKKIDFDVSSFSALAGSSYVVLASIEYEYNNLHYSSFAQTIIKIVEEGEENTIQLPTYWPVAVAFVLILIFLYYQISGRRKWKESEKEKS